MPTNKNELATKLADLGLRWTADNLADLVALATRKRWGTVQILEHIAEHELSEKRRRSLERSIASSWSRRSLSIFSIRLAMSYSSLPKDWARP